MRWAVGGVVVALVAAVTVNVLLLGYGAGRHDPVGQLTPVANLHSSPAPPPQPAPTMTVDD